MMLWIYLWRAIRHWWQERDLPEIVEVVREVIREIPVEVRVEVPVVTEREIRVEVPIEIPCSHNGMWLKVPEKVVAILPRVKEVTAELEHSDPHIQAGERKRHQVYARLMKEYPFHTWKDLAFAIEIAMRWSPNTPNENVMEHP